MITKYHHNRQTEWDEYVPPVVYVYNCAVHSAHGETPFYLAMGREPRFPYDQLMEENESERNQDQLNMYGIEDIINYKARTIKRNAEAAQAAREMLR